MLVVAMAIVGGLLIANATRSPRRVLQIARDAEVHVDDPRDRLAQRHAERAQRAAMIDDHDRGRGPYDRVPRDAERAAAAERVAVEAQMMDLVGADLLER